MNVKISGTEEIMAIINNITENNAKKNIVVLSCLMISEMRTADCYGFDLNMGPFCLHTALSTEELSSIKNPDNIKTH